jgi:hypothetical protein
MAHIPGLNSATTGLASLCRFWHTKLMVDRTKKLPARFYVTPAGRIPVREWLLGLPEEDRRTVGKDM